MEPINGAVFSTVTIGSASYPNPYPSAFSVTSSGYIRPGGATAGIDAAGTGSYVLDNSGKIYGGANASGSGSGGIGVDLTNATIDNHHNIEGGNGYNGSSGGAGLSMTGDLHNYGGAVIAGGLAYAGSGTGGVGVIFSGGTLTNDAGGLIEGGGIGFGGSATGNGGGGLVLGTNATVNNSGTIAGVGGNQNGNPHPASGGTGIVASYATDSIHNSGTVNGGDGYGQAGDGIDVSGGAQIVNQTGGKIYGGPGDGSAGAGGVGVALSGSGSLTNDSKIEGGNANGGHGGAGVTMTSATLTGVTVDNEGKIYGAFGFAGNGVGVYLDGGTLTNNGGIYGANSGAADSVLFGSNAGELKIGANAGFQGHLGGFKVGDTIDITNLAYYSGTRSDLSRDAGGYSLKTPTEGTLQLDGSFSNEHLVFSADGGGGTDVTVVANAACYRRGTRIRTLRGEIAIETLAIGDQVVTHAGAARPVRWVGHRGIRCKRYNDPKTVWPIRIQPGALGEKIPVRDLWVSPGHALLVEGVLIQACNLINGASIAQIDCDQVEYWHVELESHDVLVAEGAPAESYLDTGNRTAFLNGGAFLQAFPDFSPKHWSETCHPLITAGERLTRARAHVHARALALGYTITNEMDAHVIADGRRIDPMLLGPRRLAFAIPGRASRVELVSRTFIPAQTCPENADPRALGMCINRLQIDGADVALDDARIFAAGWHELEGQPGGHRWRWSQGRAPMPDGAQLVVVDLDGRGYFWSAPAGSDQGLWLTA